MSHSLRRTTIAIATLFSFACACQRPVPSEEPTPTHEDKMDDAPEESAPKKPAHAVGETTRDWIVQHHPNWAAEHGAKPNPAAAKSLAGVPPGARVDVYLGTWCPDSHREVTRFWRALDVAGDVPFAVEYVGLDRNFEAGDVDLQKVNVVAVPTFVVIRDGEEVGRVVETSVEGIETDLGTLLRGEASGMISASRTE